MKPIFRILRFTSELKKYYVSIGALTVLVSLMGLLQPMLSGWAIDEVRLGGNARIDYVVKLAIAIFGLDLLSNLLNNLNGFLGDQMWARLNQILSRRYYEHLLKLPQRYFDTELSGKIINRLSRSINQISNFMQMMSNNFLQFIFSTVFALVIVARYSLPVALMLLSLYPIYIWMTFKSSGKWQAYQKKKNANNDIASGRFAESISQIKVVKSFIAETKELAFFNNKLGQVVELNRPQSKHWHIKDVQRRLVLNVIFFGVYLYIFVMAAQGFFTPGQAVALILYAMQIRIPIFTISFLVENTQKAIADSKDYFEVLNLKPQITDSPNAPQLKITKGKIEFKAVSFGYERQSVLKSINLIIKPHSKVALVGESGEGKTTIVNLLLRLYEPQSGAILIDNQDISNVSQLSLRENIAVVFQDPALFSGSIKENIAYGSPSASDRSIVAAAKAANADEFIKSFPKKYDTEIGERGLKLSGGQKQRIAIARAILKDAPILILDEATSNLDSKSEALVQEALHRLMKNRTTLIIAHRLSTIQNVDIVVTLKNGQVAEAGPPSELAHSGGIYDELLKLQRSVQAKDEADESLKKFDMEA